LLGFLTIFAAAILPYYQIFNNMTKSVFYHAGCPVCVSAEHDIVDLIGASNVEKVHLGEDKSRIAEAEKAGVKSVPALLTPSGNVLHLNYGASMADVKG
jgi:glutaredoxin 3